MSECCVRSSRRPVSQRSGSAYLWPNALDRIRLSRVGVACPELEVPCACAVIQPGRAVFIF